MMKLRADITNKGEIALTANQRAYLANNAGKRVIIAIDQRTNIEKQQFIEGAIVPYYFYQHNIGVFRDFSDARNSLKEICGMLRYYVNAKGDQRTDLDSMSEIYANNSRTKDFIDQSEIYFMENGYEFPDCEDYKKWRDSVPGADEVYPPLKRLIDKYNQND